MVWDFREFPLSSRFQVKEKDSLKGKLEPKVNFSLEIETYLKESKGQFRP